MFLSLIIIFHQVHINKQVYAYGEQTGDLGVCDGSDPQADCGCSVSDSPADTPSSDPTGGSPGSECIYNTSCNPPPPPPPVGPSLYRITGTVWIDFNGDNATMGDLPVYNAPVVLTGGSGAKTAFTDITGNYWFTDVSPGTYYIQYQTTTGYASTPLSPWQNFITVSNSNLVVNFGVKPIPPAIYLPSSYCTGGIPQMTIPFTNGWYPATRYDIDRYEYDPLNPLVPKTKLFASIGTNPAPKVWFSGDPGGTFFVYDDDVVSGNIYNYRLIAYNDRFTNYLNHSIASIHAGNPIDFQGNDWTNTPWSGWQQVSCGPPDPNPIVELWLNGQQPNPWTIPVVVDRYDPVDLTWRVRNATSCTKSAISAIPGVHWVGTFTPVGNPETGTKVVNTTSFGTIDFTLQCSNAVGTISTSIKLKIDAPAPFIKTTGGDVHTNESISIPQ